MKNRSHGFTLIGAAGHARHRGIHPGLAAPSFNEFRRNSRLTGVANDFLGAVQTARTEAIKRQLPVSICPSANPHRCGGHLRTG